MIMIMLRPLVISRDTGFAIQLISVYSRQRVRAVGTQMFWNSYRQVVVNVIPFCKVI